MNEYQKGQADILSLLAKKFKPRSEEPSVDPSNAGDVADHAAWMSDNSHFEAVSKMLAGGPVFETQEHAYNMGVAHGFDEAIYEVKRGEIDPQTYQRKTT